MILSFGQKQIPTGIVYDASWGLTSGEIVIVTGREISLALPYDKVLNKTREAILDSQLGTGVMRGVGAGLVTVGVSGVLLTAKPIISSELGYRTDQVLGAIKNETISPIVQSAREQEEEMRKLAEAARLREATARFAEERGITNTDFSIYIPKIDAKAPVLVNIDAASQDTYMAALKEGVAHAYGSSLPGKDGATYIFAHSTNGAWNVSRYNAVFYLLRELNPEEKDEIYVFFQGKLHKYVVAEKHIVDSDDVSWLTEANSGPERLVLQTCWPPGTAWKRLVVVAYPEEISTADIRTTPEATAQVPYGGGAN